MTPTSTNILLNRLIGYMVFNNEASVASLDGHAVVWADAESAQRLMPSYAKHKSKCLPVSVADMFGAMLMDPILRVHKAAYRRFYNTLREHCQLTGSRVTILKGLPDPDAPLIKTEYVALDRAVWMTAQPDLVAALAADSHVGSGSFVISSDAKSTSQPTPKVFSESSPVSGSWTPRVNHPAEVPGRPGADQAGHCSSPGGG